MARKCFKHIKKNRVKSTFISLFFILNEINEINEINKKRKPRL